MAEKRTRPPLTPEACVGGLIEKHGEMKAMHMLDVTSEFMEKYKSEDVDKVLLPTGLGNAVEVIESVYDLAETTHKNQEATAEDRRKTAAMFPNSSAMFRQEDANHRREMQLALSRAVHHGKMKFIKEYGPFDEDEAIREFREHVEGIPLEEEEE